jgi:uridine phosphorylase
METRDRTGSLSVANLPTDASGRLYHLGLTKGELHPRILTVGDEKRAFSIAKLLDGANTQAVSQEELGESVVCHKGGRGFVTYCGKFRSVSVSIVAIGMGFPMMDFLVRESRSILDGDMAIIRFGTCGSVSLNADLGSIVVATSACLVSRNVNAFISLNQRRKSSTNTDIGNTLPLPGLCTDDCTSTTIIQNIFQIHGGESIDTDVWKSFYNVSNEEIPSHELVATMCNVLTRHGEKYFTVKNATCDSFYSSQGRMSSTFLDMNANMADALANPPYNVHTMDMETFYLYHLGNLVQETSTGKIFTADIKFIVANRINNEFMADKKAQVKLESTLGLYCLETLIEFPLN